GGRRRRPPAGRPRGGGRLVARPAPARTGGRAGAMLGRSTPPREGHGRLAAGEPTGLSPVALDELRRVVAKLESDVANGPIVPSVTPLEIRGYLASRYDFTKPLALDDVSADVERMLRTWQVQVTHPRYFGLFNPSVTLASIVGDTLVAMYNPQLATWR